MPQNLKAWRMALPLMGLIALAMAWSFYWYWAYSQSARLVASWRGELAGQGVTLICDDEAWSGYPFRVEVRCTKGQIAAKDIRVEMDGLSILAQAYNLKHILILVDGDVVVHSGQSQWQFTHEGAIGSVILGKRGQVQVDAEVKMLANAHFTAQSLKLHARRQSDASSGTLEMAANMSHSQFIIDNQAPVMLDEFAVMGDLSPLPESFDLPNLAQSGTVLNLSQIEVQSAAISYHGKGRLLMAADGRPEGFLQGRVQNLDHVLQALQARGILDESARMGAGAVLGLLGGNSPEGISINISAEQGGLYLGPFRLMDLPALF